jgi:Mn-containing catalase
VEHYEIAAYTTARNLAVQMRNPTLAQLLTASLGEEQNASQLQTAERSGCSHALLF